MTTSGFDPTPAQRKLLQWLFVNRSVIRVRGRPGHYWVADGKDLVAAVTVSRLRRAGLVRVVTDPKVKRVRITAAGQALVRKM